MRSPARSAVTRCETAETRSPLAQAGKGKRRHAAIALVALLLSAQPCSLAAWGASTPAPAPAPAPAPSPALPYDPQLLRLSEVLGALSYLTQLCEPARKDSYRIQMQALIDAEASAAPRREEY